MTVISSLDSDGNRYALESSQFSMGGAECALPKYAGPRQSAPRLIGCWGLFPLAPIDLQAAQGPDTHQRCCWLIHRARGGKSVCFPLSRGVWGLFTKQTNKQQNDHFATSAQSRDDEQGKPFNTFWKYSVLKTLLHNVFKGEVTKFPLYQIKPQIHPFLSKRVPLIATIPSTGLWVSTTALS